MSLLFVFGWSFSLPAAGVWEHSFITDATRLSGPEPGVWEVALVVSPELNFFPPIIVCPAGFELVLHVLNLSDHSITIRIPSPPRPVGIRPHGYKKLYSGKVQFGEQILPIVFPSRVPSRAADANPSDTLPSLPMAETLKVYLYGQTWPGQAGLHRLVWIAHSQGLSPSRLRIPAGQCTELFIATSHSLPSQRCVAGDYVLDFQPDKITLTEIFHPRGAILKLPPELFQAQLEIR